MKKRFGAAGLLLVLLAVIFSVRQTARAAAFDAAAPRINNAAGCSEFWRLDHLDSRADASLHLRANVFYGDQDGEAVPVARAEFHLLSRNLTETLKTEKFELPPIDNPDNLSSDKLYLQGAAFALLLPLDGKDASRIATLVAGAIVKHRVARLETSARGEAGLAQIAPGDYFLFGMERSGHEILVWHTEVQIKPGKNYTEVDQHNAAVVFSRKPRLDRNLAIRQCAPPLRFYRVSFN